MTGEKADAERLSDLLRDTQLGSDRARIQTQAVYAVFVRVTV